jgi:hypothetical protein
MKERAPKKFADRLLSSSRYTAVVVFVSAASYGRELVEFLKPTLESLPTQQRTIAAFTFFNIITACQSNNNNPTPPPEI